MEKLYLQDGGYVIIDKEDYERCSKHVWHKKVTKNLLQVETKLKSGKLITLGRFILGVEDDKIAIRKNTEKLDFRKSNLLIVSREDTKKYSRGHSNSTSRYKGVSWHKPNRKWISIITVNKKNIHLGLYDNEVDAATAYNNAVDKYRDGKGYKNVIGEDNRTTEKEKDWVIKQNRSRSKTGYRGVTEIQKKYLAAIYKDRERIHIGTYDTPEQAARAYDEKAIELFGEEAILNFPSERKINK